MKFHVVHKVEARYSIEVEADTVEEAKEKGNQAFFDADFGEAEEIDSEIIVVQDENGNYLYEK